ncbi:hypothetical protein, partial [Vibrio parahaemolyticus]|uniref:hypothetical protein n=1 Tax=Vibrio parahaemolyticus TaxID=670 RepID=UPI0019CFE380
MSFHFGIYRFGFLLALFITSFGIWLSTITNLTLSAHYIRVYVEWFAVGLDRAKGGRETFSLSQLAAYMTGERIA